MLSDRLMSSGDNNEGGRSHATDPLARDHCSSTYYATVNLFAYIVNVLVTYGIGVMGNSLGLQTNAELSLKYQTLVTPSGFTFAIWSIIFVSQLVWVLQQFIFDQTPSSSVFRNEMKYSYVWVVVAQCIWTIVFSLEWVTASVVVMYTLLYTLFRIVRMNHSHTSTRITNTSDSDDTVSNNRSHAGQYILQEFPFTIHFGWITVASLVNTNVALISWNISNFTTVEYVVALLSVLFVLVAAMISVFRFDFVVIPTVYAWGLYGIYTLLANNTPASILDRYSTKQIDMIEKLSLYVTISILVGIVIHGIINLFRSLLRK